MNDVNRSRNSINDVIKDILTQSSTIKPSFDKIKSKLSEVLASLKTQIETKYAK
jgi:Txe/YoeB family toxin of Txe-Axe toxin-antitoxin module